VQFPEQPSQQSVRLALLLDKLRLAGPELVHDRADHVEALGNEA
jgi:hypothetical protein